MNCKRILKILILFILFFNFKSLYANEKIVYLDMNRIMTNSLVAKSVAVQLTKYNKDNSTKFKKVVEDLKSKEKKLIAQKNIMDELEFKKEYEKIKVGYSNYNKSIDNFKIDLNNKNIKLRVKVLEVLTPIISNYAKTNSTSLILNKKDVLIGKSSLDITDIILKELDQKIKKIKLESIK